MPYTNIVFVKFKLKMLQDYRFTDRLNDAEKLVFFCLLILAGATENKVPKDMFYIKRQLNLELGVVEIKRCISTIQKVFPKLISKNETVSWTNFEEIHNYTIGKPKGNPKVIQRKPKGKRKDVQEKEKEKEKERCVKTVTCKNSNKSVKINKENKVYITHPPLVSISKEEQKELLAVYEKSYLLQYVEKLNDYGLKFPDKFKKYKNHAAVIRSWMRSDSIRKKGAMA